MEKDILEKQVGEQVQEGYEGKEGGGEDDVFDGLPMGVLLLRYKDGEMTVLSKNQALVDMLGIEFSPHIAIKKELLMKNVCQEDVDHLAEFWKHVFQDDSQKECFFRCQNGKDRGIRWFLLRGNIRRGSDGLAQILLCLTDITVQKRTEERLTKDQENFDAAVSHAGIHYWKYDIAKDCIYMNKRTSECYHLDRKLEDFPESWFIRGMVHPEDITSYQEGIDKIKAGEHYVTIQARILNMASKHYEWKNIRFMTFYQEDMTPAYAIATEQDAETYKKLEDQLELIMRQNNIRSWEIDMDGQEDACGRLVEEQDIICCRVGKLREFLNQNFELHREEESLCNEMLGRLEQGLEHVMGQMRIWSCRTKEYLWHEFNFTIIEKNGKLPVRAIVTCKDISDQKRKEQIYEEEQKVLIDGDDSLMVSSCVNLTRGIVESMEIHGIALEPEVYINISSYREGMLCYFDDIDIAKKDEEALSIPSLYQAYQEGVQNVEKLYLAREKDKNTYVCVSASVRMLERPGTGDVIAFFYHRNSTDGYVNQLAMNTLLRRDYDMAGIIFPNSRYIHMITDKFGFSGERAQDYDSFLEKIYAIFDIPGADRLFGRTKYSRVCEILEKKKVYTVEFDLEEQGRIRRKQFRFTYADKVMKSVLLTCLDVTDVVEKEREKQRQLESALALAKKASSAKSEFLSTVSHEIRTPMNVIIGMTRLAKDEQENHEAVMGYVGEIETSSSHLLNLVNNVLDMSKIESGEFSLHPQPYTYFQLQKYVSSLIVPMCREKNINFIQQDFGTHRTVLVDKMRINQVLFNLLANAVKYTPEGGQVEFCYENQVEEDTLHAIFHVKDNGIGMSRKFQAQMFKPFTQEDNTVVASVQGTGLGLSIAKGIVDKMGGKMSVDSAPGKGTKFTVEISVPVVDGAEEEDGDDFTDGISLQGRRVLVVEDHKMNQVIMSRLLCNKGAEVEIACDGKQGLDMFCASAEGEFDAILMDVRMPVMNGLEATEAIRALDRGDARTVPIFAMTANAYDEDREKSKKAGMNGHLTKPVDVKILYRTLDGCFRDRG